MTQERPKRHQNLNTKIMTAKTKIDDHMHYEGQSRRHILYSSEDVERMAVESSRARLMMQLLREPEELPEETDPYLHSNIDANKVKHKEKIPELKCNFATYPSLVHGLRWSSSIETYSEDSLIDSDEDSFKCKCNRCKMNDCLAKKHLHKNFDSYIFKDNIAKFTDNSTMTRNLIDSGCGVRTPEAKANTTEVSISTSDATVKNVLRLQTEIYPILKKPDSQNYGNNDCDKEVSNQELDSSDAVASNMCSDYENLLKSYAKQTTKNVNDKSNKEDSRRIVYNKGINNSITNSTSSNFPVHEKRVTSQTKFNKGKKVHRHKHLGQPVLPYSHQTNSKYHYDCKERNTNGKFQKHSNDVLIKAVPMKLERTDCAPSIRLPKRVLTSERNIETYMNTRLTKVSPVFKSY